MRLFRHTIWIARPREAVFDLFTDFSRAASWRQYVREMAVVGTGPLGVGSRVHAVLDISGEEYAIDLELLAFERPALWRHRTNETDLDGFIEYRFEPEGDGTRVTMQCEITPMGIYGWLSLPIMLMRRGKSYRDQLPQLKRVAEEAAAGPGSRERLQ